MNGENIISSDSLGIMKEEAGKMKRLSFENKGMDVVIVVTCDFEQEVYWEKRLKQTIKQIVKRNTIVIATHEDWNGPAGNGLGTLYAYMKAEKKAMEQYGVGLRRMQREGASIALYHAAGKGTRLAPLSGCEYNNKPSVKLPCLLTVDGEKAAMTLLEAVIKQTAVYAESHSGRLCVFWGDQIFIPSASSASLPSHHINIFARRLPSPSKEEWRRMHLEKYGIIFISEDESARQVEKINYETFLSLKQEEEVAASLGSFSLSFSILEAFLQEFSEELELKKGFLNSDQDFWMPLTLDFRVFSKILESRNVDSRELERRYKRMGSFKERFIEKNPKCDLFGVVDVGRESYWWDYGQIHHYFNNVMKLTKSTHEADAMKVFYNIDNHLDDNRFLEVNCDDSSIIFNSSIKRGRVRNSVLIGVTAEDIDVSNVFVMNTSAKRIKGKRSLFYNVVEEGEVFLSDGSVRADAFVSGKEKHLKFLTKLERNGSEDWKVRLASNPISYEELYESNSITGLFYALELFNLSQKNLIEKYRLKDENSIGAGSQ